MRDYQSASGTFRVLVGETEHQSASGPFVVSPPESQGTYVDLVVPSCTQSNSSSTAVVTVTLPGSISLTGANCTQVNTCTAPVVVIDNGEPGVLASTVMKSALTGLMRANETNITVFVYDVTGIDSGELTLKLTGQTNNASGIWTGSSFLFLPSRSYRLVYKLADGSEGVETVTAA